MSETVLDRRLAPTAGVARLVGEALLDLLLLPLHVVLALLFCRARQREVAELVRARGRHAA